MRSGAKTTHPGEAGGSCPRRPSGTSRALCTHRLCRRTAAPCSPKIDARAALPPQRWPRAGTGRGERSSGCSPAGGSFLTTAPPQPHHQHFHLHHLPQVDPDEEAGPTAHEGDTQGPEVLRDIGVGSLEPGVVFRQIHLVDPVCVGETEARRSTSHQPSSVSRAPEH